MEALPVLYLEISAAPATLVLMPAPGLKIQPTAMPIIKAMVVTISK